MKILIVGINYHPESIGIGHYTGELAAFCVAAGHVVSAVVAKPYYPNWKILAEFKAAGYIHRTENGVKVTRCPLYVPAKPTGLRRILHHISFALAAFAPILNAAVRYRPDLVIAIAPSLMTAPIARFAARLVGAKTWLHVQDFEIEAAFATGLVSTSPWIAKLASAFQSFAFGRFNRYSSISAQMCSKLQKLTNCAADVIEFRNWADARQSTSAPSVPSYAQAWNLEGYQVALYSGNISNKQGIGIIIEAARLLRERRDLFFVICGDGPQLSGLVESARDLPNVHFHPLQPRERLQDLLSLATIHLLPQLEGAADLVLPSKLTNILASGKPVVVTAQHGTGLALEAMGCGIVTPPGDSQAFANAIITLAASSQLRSEYGSAARRRAEERWSKRPILARIEQEMMKVVGEMPVSVQGHEAPF
jgi:colanic acid biosynthesis glycosyl transferase WcaI